VQDSIAQPAEAKTIKELRKEAAHKTRRIIFDNDGNEPVYYCDEATPKALLDRRTTALLGSQVDTIVYCTWSSGFSYFTHNTKVGAVFTCKEEEASKGPGSGFSKNKTQEFIDQGTDPLKIMVAFCREHNIEIFWSMRMNDTHDAQGAWYSPFLFPPLKKEHPEWLIGSPDKKPKNGTWSAVDYGTPEIRDLAFRFFEEVCRNYDVDGVELDFFRHLNYFRRPAEGEPASTEDLANMTDLLRRIRTMADEIGTQRGRPILISVRVPDSVEFCKIMGFDLVRWMEEDLIDLLVLSCYFRLSPWEDSVQLGHKYGVPVYPCLSETRLRDKEAAKVRSAIECYRARAMNVWDAGADGVYLFNFFDPTSPLWRELGSRETLEPLDKTYTTSTRGLDSLDSWFKGGKQFLKFSFVTPDNPRAIKPGASETIELRVGETVAKIQPTNVTLRLRFKGAPDPATFVVKMNDTDLVKGASEAPYADYPVKPALVKQGVNHIEIALKPDNQAEALLEDVLISVQHK
jgi:hypothetical protein